MKPVAYHRLAASELIGSAKFYERRIPSLGEAFLCAVEAALAKIQRNPKLAKRNERGIRSLRIKRFPFRVIFLEREDRIFVVAVAHLSRRPNYWERRVTT
jgi:toxin ParE1/3/4